MKTILSISVDCDLIYKIEEVCSTTKQTRSEFINQALIKFFNGSAKCEHNILCGLSSDKGNFVCKAKHCPNCYKEEESKCQETLPASA